MWFEKFANGAQKVAEEQGTEEQQLDVIGLLAQQSNHLNKLGDQLGGREKRNFHHKPVELVNAAVSACAQVVYLLFEITRKQN